ncbi:MAG: hypothetical protein ABJG15_14175 [Hyphomonadaceae bacterium]
MTFSRLLGLVLAAPLLVPTAYGQAVLSPASFEEPASDAAVLDATTLDATVLDATTLDEDANAAAAVEDEPIQSAPAQSDADQSVPVQAAPSRKPQPSAEDDIVRLPGQGELKPEAARIVGGDTERLISGGGLILSFDTDANGKVTPEELQAGVKAAFENADRNEDGRMTPLEQMAWAESLPTRDTSLANPSRFDPNLDRVVRQAEFSDVVLAFAATLADETTGDVQLEKLKSRVQGRRAIEEPVAPPRREPKPKDDDEDAQGAANSARGS